MNAPTPNPATKPVPWDILTDVPPTETTVRSVVLKWARYHGWTRDEQVSALSAFFDTAYVDDDEERHRYTFAQSLHRWLRNRAGMGVVRG